MTNLWNGGYILIVELRVIKISKQIFFVFHLYHIKLFSQTSLLESVDIRNALSIFSAL